MKKALLGGFLLLTFLLPNLALARVGVGVATGKIIVEEELNPGETYILPNFSVMNTGDEVTSYAAGIEYKQDIQELSPPKEWFDLEPDAFTLDPETIQNVQVKLNLPVKARPGNYFAFVEAHPTGSEESPGASVNVAAASKLYFTVKPANIFEGIYYKVVSFFVVNAPWSYIVLAVLVLAALIVFFRQKFSFNISIASKKD